MKYSFVLALSLCSGIASAQTFTVSITDKHSSKVKGDPATEDLYDFLGVNRYTAAFKMPDKKKHEVVVVMKSVYKDSIASIDTLLNTVPWQKKVVGGFPWDPKEGALFLAQRIDSTHMRVRFKFWMLADKTIELPWPNHGYMLDEGIRSGGKYVTMELGKPMPIMVLTQPYPDPPPPKEAVIYRYCFGSDEPPEQWPTKYGVEHLYVFELTVLP
ncbi:MAG: hypothetical protein JNL43_10145 [Flavobacteriales bacterium]|nr:hypothetical protein [Flavobacteriales bacterium]